MPLAEEIARLDHLRETGALSEQEFQEAKARVLHGDVSPGHSGLINGMAPNTWCMLMHLSQLLNFVAPSAGLVAPIVMWAVSKDKLPEADRHGKVIFNWMISSLIYALVSGLLLFVLIGFPMLLAVAALAIIFPIIGAIKANEGIVWHYPLTIRFMDPDSQFRTSL
ncbi:MAG: DUF4870 domain-containing protein [Planctomycetaceae bacterium]